MEWIDGMDLFQLINIHQTARFGSILCLFLFKVTYQLLVVIFLQLFYNY